MRMKPPTFNRWLNPLRKDTKTMPREFSPNDDLPTPEEQDDNTDYWQDEDTEDEDLYDEGPIDAAADSGLWDEDAGDF